MQCPRTNAPGCACHCLAFRCGFVRDAVRGAVVNLVHVKIVLVDAVVQHVVDLQFQLVFFEEGFDLFDALAVIYELLHIAQLLEECSGFR